MAKVTRCIFRSKRCERPRGERDRNPAYYNDDIFSSSRVQRIERKKKRRDRGAVASVVNRLSSRRALPLMNFQAYPRDLEHDLLRGFDLFPIRRIE